MADATETVETPVNSDVKIEDAGPARKKLTITIPADVVSEKIDDSYTTLAMEAHLPGFRKGHAPRKLIERRFGTNVMSETCSQLVADAYSKAIEDNKLKTVGEPEGDDLEKLEIEPGKPLTFSIEVEVAPEFELPKLEGIPVKKPVVEVTQQHIDDEKTRQTFRHGEPMEVEDGLKPGDRFQGRAILTDEKGEEVNDIPEAVIAIPLDEDDPRGHVLGLLVEDMHSLFCGKKVGDNITIETTVSESDERTAIRGQKVKIDITINKGVRVIPAELKSVLEIYGMENEQELTDQIVLALNERAQQEQHSAMREQLSEYLTKSVDFELPEKMSAAQAARQLDRLRMELLYRGMPEEDVETRIAELRAESETKSRERLKFFFVVHKLGDHFDVKVNEQEINGRIAEIAAQRGERPEQLRAQLSQQGGLQQIAMQIREHKALDRLLDTAEIKEISAEEWNEMVGGDSGGDSGDTGGSKKKTTKKKTTKKTTKKTSKKK